MADDPNIRLREHNYGALAYLLGAPHEPPVDCADKEGWRRGYRSAQLAMLGEAAKRAAMGIREEARDG